MKGFRKSKGMSFTPFRSAAEEVATKRSNEDSSEHKGEHVDAPGARIVHVVGAELPYVAVPADSVGDANRAGFATMREAEAFIKRSTPMRTDGRLSPLYDRPVGG